MPVTPFHFGPGFFIKSIVPDKFSFKVFVLANVLIDLEPLYYILTNQYPLHRFFHTYMGAAVGAFATMLLGSFIWRKISKVAIVAGALIGTYSHVFLDSIMHPDLKPFYPFTDTNHMLNVLSYFQLHMLCLCSGIIGLILYYLRKISIYRF